MGLIKKIYALLDRKARKRAIVLIIVMFFGAAFEAVGIGLIFPFIALLGNPDSFASNSRLKWVYIHSGLGSHQQFIICSASFLLAVFIVKSFYLAFMNYAQFKFAFTSQVSLSNRLFSHYLRSPYSFHTQHNSAELLRNVNSEVLWIFNHVLIPLMAAMVELFVLLLIGLILIVASPKASVVAFVFMGGVGGGFYFFIKRKMRVLGKNQQEHISKMIQWVNQGLGGIKDTKVRGTEDYFLNAYRRSAESYSHANIYLKTVESIPRMFIETLGIAGILTGCIVLIARGEDLTKHLPFIALFAMSAMRIMPSLNRVISCLTGIRFYSASVDVVYSDLIRDSYKQENSHFNAGQSLAPSNNSPITFNRFLGSLFQDIVYSDLFCGSYKQKNSHFNAGLSLAPSNNNPITFDREIMLDRIFFKYPERDQMVLNGISLTINKGTSVGLVGTSGAGKSTLVDVMLGLLNTVEGSVLVDGRPISENLRSWQSLIGYIPQSVYLMDDTIRRNVAFGIEDVEISDDKIWQSLREAQLESFVRGLKDGLSTRVGENGVCLSGGQKQRLGIARALYGNPQILVLDEATSSLDSETEQEISKVITALKGDKTLLVIAHRLTTIMNSDCIFILKDGRVSNSGTFEYLKKSDKDFQALLYSSKLNSVTL